MSIRVLLVDDHTIIRDGLASLLNEESDIAVVAEAGSGQEALAKVNDLLPDVVVMDLTLPDMGGVQVTRRILKEYPQIKILVLTMFLDENCVMESLDAGAQGYLVKDCAAEELVSAIRALYQKKPYFCAGAQQIMMKRCLSETINRSGSQTLSKREVEVLQLTAQGMSIKEIATILHVSSKMIEVHRSNIRKKLNIQSIAQLTTYALKHGLIAE